MDKIKLAHQMACAMMASNDGYTIRGAIECALEYADAMQAEADKREQQEQNKLKQEQQNHHDELISIGLEEWQPDWSQAPIGYDWFCVGSNGGHGFFSNQEPEFFEEHYFVGADGFVVNNHGYQGNWQDSLRKRPEPKCEVDWSRAPKEYHVTGWYIFKGVAHWIADEFPCGPAPSFGFAGTHIVERPHGF